MARIDKDYPITDLAEDWEGHSGEQVQEFLKGRLSNIENKLESVDTDTIDAKLEKFENSLNLISTSTEDMTEMYENKVKFFPGNSKKWSNAYSSYIYRPIKGETWTFTAGNDNNGYIAFVPSGTTPVHGEVMTFANETDSRQIIPAGESKSYYIKESCDVYVEVSGPNIIVSSKKEYTNPSLYAKYTRSNCGAIGSRAFAETLDANQAFVFEKYPKSNQLGERYQFECMFDTFIGVKIGKGIYKSSNIGFGDYLNVWVEIDNENIYVYSNLSSGAGTSATLKETIEHGMTITKFLKINLSNDYGDCKMHIALYTYGTDTSAYFTAELEKWYPNANGIVQAIVLQQSRKAQFSAINKYFKCPFWIFGASYEQVNEKSMWQYWAHDMGVKGYLSNSRAGRGSDECFEDFKLALQFGSPKFVYWTMFGNGSTESLDEGIAKMKEWCDVNGATLIIIKRPNSTSSNVSDVWEEKDRVIQKYINKGVRYVDASKALSEDYSNPNGWYEGYLGSDGQHPTTYGARSLAMQVMQDIPEIMQW